MDNSSYNILNLIAAYLSAIGTVAAVIVALFLQVFIVRWRRPKLVVRLVLDREAGDLEAWRRRSTGVVNCWLGVRVEATRGRDAARNVRAYLLKVVRPGSSLAVGNYPAAGLDWTNSGGADAIQIPSGGWRRLTLLRYIAAVDGREACLMPTTVLPVREPYNERYLLSVPGQYSLVFEISADGIDPELWCLSFQHKIIDVSDDRELMRERLTELKCARMTASEIARLGV